jgi:hypothetical protein
VQLRHVLELNEIRLALECSDSPQNWTSEPFIRVLNLSSVLRYAKIYDAVARVSLGEGLVCDFAIEYERTLKSEQRYETVIEAIANEKRLNVVLYLTSSYEVAATLQANLKALKGKAFFAHAEDFKRKLLDTEVAPADEYRSSSLRSVLMRAACAEQPPRT